MWFQCLFFVAVAASIAPLMQAPHYLLQAYQRVQTRTNEVTAAMQQLVDNTNAQTTRSSSNPRSSRCARHSSKERRLGAELRDAEASEIVNGICWWRVQVGNTVLISADRL